MSDANDKAVSLYHQMGKVTAITEVVDLATIRDAIDYAIANCEKKEFCKLIMPTTPGGKVDPANLPRATVKSISALGLPADALAYLKEKAQEKGFEVIEGPMRDRMAGFDVTISIADFGIAESATCCICTANESLQLSTMLCENHIVILPKAKLYESSDQAADELHAMLEKDACYTSFISGPSRTADIERIAAFGVHGPLELYVAIVEA